MERLMDLECGLGQIRGKEEGERVGTNSGESV